MNRAESSMLFSPPLPTSVGSKGKSCKAGAAVSTGNDDFDQLLASIHTKISQDFGGATTHSSPSPIAPASASSTVSVPLNGTTPPKERTMTKEEKKRLKKLRSSLNVQDYQLWEEFSAVTARLNTLKLSEKLVEESTTTKATMKGGKSVPEAESLKMLPFKKRAYKGEKVPSPKTTDGTTKASAKTDGNKERNGLAKSLTAVTSQATPAEEPEKIPKLKLKVSRTASGKVQTARSSTSISLLPDKPLLKPKEIQVVIPKSATKPVNSKKILPLLAPKVTPSLVLIAPKPSMSPPEKPLSLSESLKLILSPPAISPVVDPLIKKRGRPKKRSVEADGRKDETSVEPSTSSTKKMKVAERELPQIPPISEEDKKQMEELQAKFNMTRNVYNPKSLGDEMHKDHELKQCDCSPPVGPNTAGCGYGCASRSSYFECDPKDCPCGARCTNNAIQKKKWAENLELFKTEKKGFGVRCVKPIRRGSLICEYVGEVVTWEAFRERTEKVYNNNVHHYCLKLDGTKVIDAYSQGGIARFINHSCEPNSQFQNWVVEGKDRMAIFATKDIPAGEEITYDYKFESFEVQQPCFCDSKICRGFTGVQKSQKLNGLLMKKRASNTTTATPTTNSPSRPPTCTPPKVPVTPPSHKDLTIFIPPLTNGLPITSSKKSPLLSPTKKTPPATTTNGWLFADPPTPPSSKTIGFPAKKKPAVVSPLVNGVATPTPPVIKPRKPIISPLQKILQVKIQKITPPKNTPKNTAEIISPKNTPEIIPPKMTPVIMSVLPKKRPISEAVVTNGPSEKLDEAEKTFSPVASSTPLSVKKAKRTSSVLDGLLLSPSVKSEKSASPIPGKKSPLSPLVKERKTKRPKTESNLVSSVTLNGPSEKAATAETDTVVARRNNYYLPRNLRRLMKDEKKAKRPKVPILCTPIELPSLACEALKGVRGSSRYEVQKTVVKKDEKRDSSEQLYPPSYFRPLPWEPSHDEIIRFFSEEVIRCSCGIYLEDGSMTECEQCQTWQHNECVGVPPSQDKQYKCPRCLNSKTPLEIHQNLPAAMNPDSLDCYTTLMAPNCQNFPVRVGDCVYLTKDRSPVNPDALYDPLTLDIVRVDKMWIEGTTGNKKLFGNHYLRPHETYHEATRSFYENELLKSPVFETVALEAVLGRCCIMDPLVFAKGKPKEYPIEHCFICDLKTNKKATSFDRMKTHERPPINMKMYYFEYYPEKLTIRRTFKPHGILVTKKKQKADAARKKSDQPKAILDVVRDKCERIQSVMDGLSEKAARAQDKSAVSSSSASLPT